MPTKLKDTIEKVYRLSNQKNADLLSEFFKYLKSVRTSNIHKNECFKNLTFRIY